MGDYSGYHGHQSFGDSFYGNYNQGQNPNLGDHPHLRTLLFNDIPSVVNEHDLRRTFEDERVRYLDMRFVRDHSRCFAFVDFATDDVELFMRNFQNGIKVKGFTIICDYTDPKEESTIMERIHEPTSNILIRGMPLELTEADIIEYLKSNNVPFTAVRVIRDRSTGLSRRFGYIEFASVQEAIHWMDAQKGLLEIGRDVMRLKYSHPRSHPDSSRGESGHRDTRPGPNPEFIASGDWRCQRCSIVNFKRRDFCFRCQHPRNQPQMSMNVHSSDGSDLIGTMPCNALVLRYLDPYTNESSIQTAFSEQYNTQIKRCYVIRSHNNSGPNFAIVELATVADAYQIVDSIVKEHKIVEIDGKVVAVSYAKNNFNTMLSCLKAEGLISGSEFTNRPPPNLQGSTVQGYSSYVGAQLAKPATTLTNSGPAVAEAALQMKHTEARVASIVVQSLHNSQGLQHQQAVPYASTPAMPFNAATAADTQYPFPDTSKFLFDETTRFYYDPNTGLLYEPNSRYFFDRVTQQYFHYDANQGKYIPASQLANQQNKVAGSQNAPDGAKKKEKKEKEKTAQQIAKEMEKWAKRMNSQKESSASAPKVDQTNTETSKTADMGYAILQSSNTKPNSPKNPGLVAQYGGDSEEEDAQQVDEKELEVQVTAEESKLMDWTNLACRLCSRGFKDIETMQKHRVLSTLHIQNLNKLRAKYGLKELTPQQQQQHEQLKVPAQVQKLATGSHVEAIETLMQLGAASADHHAKDVAAIRQKSSKEQSSASGGGYRDRARERREKFGSAVPPPMYDRDQISAMPTTPRVEEAEASSSYNFPLSASANVGGVGGRLMEKMGWQAGQGLGKASQGRTKLVEVEFREVGVGLGVKAATKRLPPSDNYRDNAKRAMYARYHELG